VGYELLTGARPFERGSDTAEAAAHINEPVPPASGRRTGLPLAVDQVFERAFAKDPGARYPSAAAFVRALDDALAGREATTRLLPAAPPPPAVRRRPPPQRGGRPPWMVPLLLALLVLALAAGVLAAVLSSQDDRGTSTQPTEQPVTVTAEQTVGTTVVTTTLVTTTAPAAPGPASLQEAVQLTDEATRLLEQEQWEEALRTQRRGLKALEGTYTDEFRYEAYAAYNTGKALAELGRCEQAVRYLDRSEELQGHRREIDEARMMCEASG
jgi:tetratricopeptide (TPR) repeat protein